MIKIVEVQSKKELRVFVKFPFKLYQNSKNWVPPIIREELKVFDASHNPVLKDASIKLFLAYKNEVVVGRIAAIINWLEVKEQKIKKMRFGWFDVIDDYEVSALLLKRVKDIGKQNNLNFMEGPMGFSNLDKVGVLSHGFEHIGTMVTNYNHSYYINHFEKHGFKIEKELLEHKHAFSDIKLNKHFRLAELIKKRYGLHSINFQKTSDVMQYADRMFDLFNKSYASLSSFVKITPIQKAFFKEKFIGFINPEYIKFVANETGELVAFGIVMPSFAKALQKMKGKLFPFGFLHLLRAKKTAKEVNFYLIGVDPDYQSRGVHTLIFTEFHKTFSAKNIEWCRRTPELSDNKEIQKLWKDFNPILIKKRCTYKKIFN